MSLRWCRKGGGGVGGGGGPRGSIAMKFAERSGGGESREGEKKGNTVAFQPDHLRHGWGGGNEGGGGGRQPSLTPLPRRRKPKKVGRDLQSSYVARAGEVEKRGKVRKPLHLYLLCYRGRESPQRGGENAKGRGGERKRTGSPGKSLTSFKAF